MSKLVLAMFMSLDGYIEGPKGEFVSPDWSGDLQRYWADDNTDAAGMLLYGRVNFEFNAGFWQPAAADESNPAELRSFARKMNDLPKIVFSRSLKNPGWNGRVVTETNIPAEIARLKQQPGPDLMMFGGAGIAQAFMKLDLIDEYRLLVTPTLLGGGKRLFEGSYDRAKLKLVKSQALDTGAVLLYYQRPA
jgi:dihydrofolate reductase